MHNLIRATLVVFLSGLGSIATASELTLTSSDIAAGQLMTSTQVYAGFGCTGENMSPHLSWSGAPEGTASFALLVFDPDAPTGSGWWHWQLINIPSDVTTLAANSGNTDGSTTPDGSLQMRNDFGEHGFGGACPPEGHGAHRYQFTIYALSTVLDVPKTASAALVGYMVNANALASSTLEALYER